MSANPSEVKSVIEVPAFSRREERELPMVQANPMAMLASAVARGMAPSVLKDLMDLQQRFEKSEAEKAYNEAFSAFKAEAVQIIRGKSVDAGPLAGKKYAELYAVVDAVTPALSKHGLSASWKITKDEKDWIEVTCSLKHVKGHSESVTMGGPPDAGGAKNGIQARASTVSYLERYTLKAICGVAEKNEDTDGAGGKHALTEQQAADFAAAIETLTTRAEADALWEKIVKACEAAGDVPNYEGLKKALLAKSKAFPKGEK